MLQWNKKYKTLQDNYSCDKIAMRKIVQKNQKIFSKPRVCNTFVTQGMLQ
jgi:hypothetical protein